MLALLVVATISFTPFVKNSQNFSPIFLKTPFWNQRYQKGC